VLFSLPTHNELPDCQCQFSIQTSTVILSVLSELLFDSFIYILLLFLTCRPSLQAVFAPLEEPVIFDNIQVQYCLTH